MRMKFRRHGEHSEAIQFSKKLDCFPLLKAGVAMTFLSLVLCITGWQAFQVATADHAVPEIQLAQVQVSKPVIKHGALFGEFQGSKPLQESGLNFQLTAVFAMDDPKAGSAVISASGRKPLLQVVGDALPGGVKLKEVHPDYVVLEQAGEQSILRLPKKSL